MVCPAARRAQRVVERVMDIGLNVDAVCLETAVGEPQRQVVGPFSAEGEAGDATEQELVVDVPDPAHVLAVGRAIVQQHHHVEIVRLEQGHADVLVCAGWVLGQQQHQLSAVELNTFAASEGGVGAAEGWPDRLGCDRQREGRCGRRGGVVRVV